MSEQRISSYREFWPYYLGEHAHPTCRALHYFGTLTAVSMVGVAVATSNPWLLLVALVSGYGPAWVGHFFVEHNRPATFTYPLWSFVSDFKMLAFALTGKIGAELTRLGIASPEVRENAPQ